MASRAKKYWYARRPMGYNGQEYARGQILINGLAGAKNDEKLIRLGYLAEHAGEVYAYRDNPDILFVGELERHGYGQMQDRISAMRRHGMTIDQIEDAVVEEAIRQANEAAPVLEPAS